MNNKRNPEFPPDSSEDGHLDYAISANELYRASYVLKPNKACGFDSISNEMILGLLEVKPNLIIKLFNDIFLKNSKISQWSVSMITPIFKSGLKTDPSNYRGISVLSCLRKLFSSVLNQRLLQFVLDRNILSKKQLGFVEGNRASDAHLILHSLLQLYCHKRGQKVFSCFIDFRKAFDGIPRDVLFKKLLKIGISGKLFNSLETLYQNDNCTVKLSNGLTNAFVANQGVKQGCILSPLLFNIFLADLPDYLRWNTCEKLVFCYIVIFTIILANSKART